MITMKTSYNIADTVYLRVDDEQLPHIVTSFSVRPQGHTVIISRAGQEVYVYEFEISHERNLLATLNIADHESTR